MIKTVKKSYSLIKDISLLSMLLKKYKTRLENMKIIKDGVSEKSVFREYLTTA